MLAFGLERIDVATIVAIQRPESGGFVLAEYDVRREYAVAVDRLRGRLRRYWRRLRR